MGSLVFQATLGGQVNLNGPNTASTFDIAVPATTGTMVTTGDSGTVTNTMLAASAYNTPGTIGSGTANTGAFTTLSASSTVSGTGFSTYLASPPAIGGTTAASGRFSSLTNTGLTSGRVVYSTTGGLETDSANLLYSGTDLTVYGLTVGRGGGAIASNTAAGASALGSNTTGSNNVAVGQNALLNNITGTQNTATGASALGSNTGSQNTAFGYRAATATTSGNYIVAVGTDALRSNTTGSYNVAVGGSALDANTTGSDNIAMGLFALKLNTTGSDNTAIGHASLANSTGNNNAALGSGALQSNTTASNNTAVGYQALYSNTTVGSNTAFGYQAASLNTGGIATTAIGLSALKVLTTGNYNTALGYEAGLVLTTGESNTYLGFRATASGINATGEIVLCTGASTGKGSNTGFINTSNGVYQGNNSAAWSITSDQRIKKNIVDVASGLDKILALRPVEFDYKENDKHEVGFIAQEYQQVLPNQVTTHVANESEKQWVDEDGMVMGVTQNLVPYLVKAIQELKAEFDAYKASHP